MYICEQNSYLCHFPFSNQRPGPHRFQGNDEFVGISSSHESLVKLMEMLDEVEDYKVRNLIFLYSSLSFTDVIKIQCLPVDIGILVISSS